MKLFVIDFDQTIADANTHNLFTKSDASNIDELWVILAEVSPIGGSKIWEKTLRGLLDDGHMVSIASFNSFGSLLFPRYLEKVIGLSEEEVAKIHIESWLPVKPDTADKNTHISSIIKDKKFLGDTKSVVLVDDDISNIIAAHNQGYTTIHATGTHMLKIQQMSSDTPAKDLSVFHNKKRPTTQDCPLKCTIL